MALKWLSALVACGEASSSLTTALDTILSLHPSSLPVLQAALQHHVTKHTPYTRLYTLFTDALTNVQLKASLPLWEIIHEWLKQSHADKLEKFLQRGLGECAEVCTPVKLWYLEFAAGQNIGKVREIYKRITAFPPLDVEVFQKYINIELKQDPVNMKQVRSAYEAAIREFGATSTNIWLGLIRCELGETGGRPQRVGDLYSQAVRTLEGEFNERFLTQYTLLQTGHL